MGSERFTLRVAVYLILKQDNKVLLLRRFQTGWSDGWYTLPAGHIDGGETITQALIREGKEETGVSIQPQNLRIVHTMHRMSDVEYIDFFGFADSWEGTPFIGEPDKCDDLQWFAIDKLHEKTLPYINHVLGLIEQQSHYSEYGWDKHV